MERRPQRGTNRGRSGMIARSTDGHKTNASLGAEHLDGVWDGDAKALAYFRKITTFAENFIAYGNYFQIAWF